MEKEIKKELEGFLFRVSSEIVNEAQNIAPFKKGRLREDIRVFDKSLSSFELEIGNTKAVDYARYVHQGTKPFSIRAKNKKALANKKAGLFFGKKVNHPGIKANPYLVKASNNYLKSSSFSKAVNSLEFGVKSEIKEYLANELKNVEIKIT